MIFPEVILLGFKLFGVGWKRGTGALSPRPSAFESCGCGLSTELGGESELRFRV